MLRNYLQTAARNLYRNKITTAINILGLSLAIAFCIPFYHIIRHEKTFDHFHERADRIYRVILDHPKERDRGGVHFPAAEALESDFPEFELITIAYGPDTRKLVVHAPGSEPRIFQEDKILFVDQNFLKTLDFKSQTPISPSALAKPNEALLTESLAKKLFPAGDALGKSIAIGEHMNAEVVGILDNPPAGTNLPFHLLVSYATFDLTNERRNDWLWMSNVTLYVTLRPGDKPEKFRRRLQTFTEKHVAFYKPDGYQYALQPLKEVHSSQGFEWDFSGYYMPPELIWLPASLGLLIIIIASINFINLSMAHALTLVKETGVRKAVGSSKSHLVLRFLIQTAIVLSIALLIGLLGGFLLLNRVNYLFAIVDYQLKIDVDTLYFLVILGIAILLTAGLYPALVLAHAKPANIFRNQMRASVGGANASFRKGLVLFQVGGSILLLIAAFVITAQIKFWRTTDLGFRYSNILTFPVPAAAFNEKELLRQTLLAQSGIEKVSFSSGAPLNGFLFGSGHLAGTNEKVAATLGHVDEEFTSIYHLSFAAGNNVADSSQVLINRTMSKSLGFKNPEDAIGNTLEVEALLSFRTRATIIGVLEDFINTNPIEAKILPSIYLFRSATQANVQLAHQTPPDIKEQIGNSFKKTFPQEIFSPIRVTSKVEESFELESLMENAIRPISMASTIISCIGIFGMVSFMGNQRRKEFSVRKVFGASRKDIAKVFLWDFGLLVLAGFLLGGSMAFWLIPQWLQQYKRHMMLEPVYFIQALLILVLVTALTILYQVRQSSRVNPAETLRGE